MVVQQYFTRSAWAAQRAGGDPGRPAVDTMCMFVTASAALIHRTDRVHEEGPPLLEVLHHLNLFVFSMPSWCWRTTSRRRSLAGRAPAPVPASWSPSFERESAALGGQEGVHLHPLVTRVPGRHLHHLRADGGRSTRAVRGAGSSRSFTWAAATATGGVAPPAGRHGQVGGDPAVQLAARRHGGPHARLGVDPRRHHGDGRVYLLCRMNPVLHSTSQDAETIAVIGGARWRSSRRDDRGAAGHQEGPGVLDRIADRLHGAGRSAWAPTSPPSS